MYNLNEHLVFIKSLKYLFLIILCCFLIAFISASLRCDRSTPGGLLGSSGSGDDAITLWTTCVVAVTLVLWVTIGFGLNTIPFLGGETCKLTVDYFFRHLISQYCTIDNARKNASKNYYNVKISARSRWVYSHCLPKTRQIEPENKGVDSRNWNYLNWIAIIMVCAIEVSL